MWFKKQTHELGKRYKLGQAAAENYTIRELALVLKVKIYSCHLQL